MMEGGARVVDSCCKASRRRGIEYKMTEIPKNSPNFKNPNPSKL